MASVVASCLGVFVVATVRWFDVFAPLRLCDELRWLRWLLWLRWPIGASDAPPQFVRRIVTGTDADADADA
ncbi:MAG TPA: hypothetical protein VLT32_08440, partial [Candidatus Sulfomarinibacteraceae bacterium]|nr:hypothetical protein [Candidatus Sulfomarinibacteraceae bacterium]